MIGGAYLIAKRDEEEEGMCGQLAKVDPKLGVACASLPIIGKITEKAASYLSGAVDTAKDTAGAVGAYVGGIGQDHQGVMCWVLKDSAKQGNQESAAKLKALQAQGSCL